MIARLDVLLAALALAIADPAAAQQPASTEVAPQAKAPPASRRCATIQRRVANEERALAGADASIGEMRQAREKCDSRGACARYDQTIKSMEVRRSRHDVRLGKLRIEAAKVCKTG